MFSEMIQGLLSSGGQANAMKRYQQVTNYINGVPAKGEQTPKTSDIQLPNASSIQSFDKVLQSTAKAQFGTLLKNRGISSVDASIYTNPNVNFNKRATRDEIISMIDDTSAKYGVDAKLIKALVKQESGFTALELEAALNTNLCGFSVSTLAVMPSTAKGLGVKDPLDAKQNIEGGVKYVKSLLNRFDGNIILALAAYNAGPNAVKKYNGIPPYKETQNYVKSILKNYL